MWLEVRGTGSGQGGYAHLQEAAAVVPLDVEGDGSDWAIQIWPGGYPLVGSYTSESACRDAIKNLVHGIPLSDIL